MREPIFLLKQKNVYIYTNVPESKLSALFGLITLTLVHSCKSWSLNKTYVSVDDLKCKLGKAFAQYVSNFDFEIGYIMPGHGMNGKLHGLADDEDLSSMYEVFEARKNFILWIKCRVKSKKRPASSVLPLLVMVLLVALIQSVLDLCMTQPFGKCMKLMLSWLNWKRSTRRVTLRNRLDVGQI